MKYNQNNDYIETMKKQLEIKNDITKIKKTMEEINNRLEEDEY